MNCALLVWTFVALASLGVCRGTPWWKEPGPCNNDDDCECYYGEICNLTNHICSCNTTAHWERNTRGSTNVYCECEIGYSPGMTHLGLCCRNGSITHDDMYESYNTTLYCNLEPGGPEFTKFVWHGVECDEKDNSRTCTFRPRREDYLKEVQCSFPDCPGHGPFINLPVRHVSSYEPSIQNYDGKPLWIGSRLELLCVIRGGYPVVSIRFECFGLIEAWKITKETTLAIAYLYLEEIDYSMNDNWCFCTGQYDERNVKDWVYKGRASLRLRVHPSWYKGHGSRYEDDTIYAFLALLLVIPAVAVAAVFVRRSADRKNRERYERQQAEMEASRVQHQAQPQAAQPQTAHPAVGVHTESQVDAQTFGVYEETLASSKPPGMEAGAELDQAP